jgi:oxygen-independent coproporphyrinogen-3 oxidase
MSIHSIGSQVSSDFSFAELNKIQAQYAAVGPRYTSYPTALEFNEQFSEETVLHSLRASNESPQSSDLSLYLHLPFCRHLCFYCGCNKVVTKNKQKARDYMVYLGKEIEMISKSMDSDRKIAQLHLGGGTPTFYSIEQLRQLIGTISRHFRLANSADRDYSIEIDPRTVDREYIHALPELGFNRISIGIQDFDYNVQKAIHRIQDSEHIVGLVEAAKDSSINSINFDLVYGLPKQTLEGFGRTLDQVVELGPDRISLYHYAHLPDRFPAQRRILDSDLPDSDTRLGLQRQAMELLCSAGYCHIGMDHFAKKDDSLTHALENGTIQRNFQGYTTHQRCELLGIGVSAISDIGGALYQNEKTLEDYYKRIDQNHLPVAKGLVRTTDDEIRQDVIMNIMCNGRIDKQEFTRSTNEDFDSYFDAEQPTIARFVKDGLVGQDKGTICVTDTGRYMLRNIAIAFDLYRRHMDQAQGFSRIM